MSENRDFKLLYTEASYYTEQCKTNALTIYYRVDKCSEEASVAGIAYNNI